MNTFHFDKALFHDVEIQHLEFKEQIDLHQVRAKDKAVIIILKI